MAVSSSGRTSASQVGNDGSIPSTVAKIIVVLMFCSCVSCSHELVLPEFPTNKDVPTQLAPCAKDRYVRLYRLKLWCLKEMKATRSYDYKMEVLELYNKINTSLLEMESRK